VHQYCRIGRGAMFTGGAGASLDLPMWFTITATNVAGSLNIVGMRRFGMTAEEVQSVRWVYKTMYRGGSTPQQALPELDARTNDPIVAEYAAFIRGTKRGITHGTGRSSRGQTPSSHGKTAAETA
jgi:UDP-N-acetylglucosamine acyltransferase